MYLNYIDMKKLQIITVLLLAITLFSCKKQDSLQAYLVESQDKENFKTFDFSTSMLPIEMNDNMSEEDIKTFKSIKKVNVAFLPKGAATEEEIAVEKNKIKNILKNSDYKTLMKFNDKRGKATIYYLGESEAIDEIVGFANVNEMGVGIVRLLGDSMNPAAIMKMMKSTKMNANSSSLKSLEKIFKDKNFLN